jgi:ATP-dependent RNA helicase DDX52/ROK1
MLSLPKPSKMKRKALKKSPVERKSVANVAGRGIGRGQAIRTKEMKEGSKRRKAVSAEAAQNPSDDEAMSMTEA